LYLILAYLTIFRLEELTFPEYRKFIESQEPDKMSVFISYVFDVSRLASSVKWDWLKIFDLEYVEDYMLRPISDSASAAEKMRLEMLAKASGLAAEKEASDGRVGIPELPKKAPTRAVSPRLTKAAPRLVPAPEKIPQEVLAGKEPRYLERTSLGQIEEAQEARRKLELEKTLKKYSESSVQPFELHKTRSDVQVSRRDAEAKDAGNLQFEATHGPSVPFKPPTEKAEFRMNASAYLREDSLYKKKQEDEVKLIKAYESELRDSTEYFRWQTEMREKDLQGRREQVERVRMLAKLSAEEAQQAMEKQRNDNAEIAALIKAESSEMHQQRMFESEMHRVMNKQLVNEVIAVREHAPKEAQARLLEQRKERRTVIREELTALQSEREEEERRLQAAREEKAKQLKALSEVHPTLVQLFDPTESIGIGLLDEMSLVEMKERLAINKVREEENEKSKRQEIVNTRQKQQFNLRKRIENIQRIRAAASSANTDARSKQKAKEDYERMQKDLDRKMENCKLQDTLDKRREETLADRQALQDEEERRLNQRSFGGSGVHAAEERHFEELLKGAEREATQRQVEAQQAAQIYEVTKQRGRDAEKRETKKVETTKVRFFAAQAKEIERKRKELVQKQKEDIATKKSAFMEQRKKHKSVKEKIIALNPYANTLTEATRTKREKQRVQSR
jgi:hypothetical protein